MSTTSICRVLIFVLLGNQNILRIDAKKAICKFEPIDDALGKEYKYSKYKVSTGLSIRTPY